jgi:hypothetical protein
LQLIRNTPDKSKAVATTETPASIFALLDNNNRLFAENRRPLGNVIDSKHSFAPSSVARVPDSQS